MQMLYRILFIKTNSCSDSKTCWKDIPFHKAAKLSQTPKNQHKTIVKIQRSVMSDNDSIYYKMSTLHKQDVWICGKYNYYTLMTSVSDVLQYRYLCHDKVSKGSIYNKLNFLVCSIYMLLNALKG